MYQINVLIISAVNLTHRISSGSSGTSGTRFTDKPLVRSEGNREDKVWHKIKHVYGDN